jgi:hypothetical protein
MPKGLTLEVRHGDAWVRRVVKEYRAGVSAKKIADAESVSEAAIGSMLTRLGIPKHSRSFVRKGLFSGKKNPHWNERGRAIRKDGYAVVRVTGGRWVREHRVLMERKVGRKLLRHEYVHHRNGNKLDNRISNLELMSASQHSGHHMTSERARHMARHAPRRIGVYPPALRKYNESRAALVEDNK